MKLKGKYGKERYRRSQQKMKTVEIPKASPVSTSPHPRQEKGKNNPECIWALFHDYLHNTLWWVDTHLNPRLFCICRLQKPCFQCRAGYQEETIKAKEWAFKLGPFDCVTDWFQVRQLWKLQPEENCPSVQCLRGREASRLAWCAGIPILLTFGGISKGWTLGLKNLVVVDCSYI